MKILFAALLLTITTLSFAETRQVVKKTTTTKSSGYVVPEKTDSTVINKKTKINPRTINADGTITPATQTTTTKKTRKY